jgi:hypothetical protein
VVNVDVQSRSYAAYANHQPGVGWSLVYDD